MPEILPIAQLGDPILREPASKINDLSSVVTQGLVEDMLLTVADAGGVGIAGPQVSEGKQIFIIASRANKRYPNAPDMEPMAVINPEILWESDETVKDWEGCLSIPGVRGLVPRHEKIGVRYLTRDGIVVEREYEGFLARIFQHEFDHLNGIVFFDQLESTKDIVMEREYQRLIAE